MTRFEDVNPSIESYWRSIILFGRNFASFKFALAKVLLDFADKDVTAITLSDFLPLHYGQESGDSLSKLSSSLESCAMVCNGYQPDFAAVVDRDIGSAVCCWSKSRGRN